jgi:glyceraldehyde 3-phosphate dehydrogenase (phosphorylating)
MGAIAIHGFGRIGRSTLKAAARDGAWVPTVISDVKDPVVLGALLEFDSNYGRWELPVSATADSITVGDDRIAFLDVSSGVPDWGALGVEVVVDCSGRAVARDGAQAHLDRGAQRVLVSALSRSLDDCDAVLLRGINADTYDPTAHRIVSMASCTTNALAPVVKVLEESFGIQQGFFSTVHAYTNTQSVADQPMRDRRDSWAAAENIIPAASGAAKALAFIWPELAITGKAYRIPVRTGSIVELNATLRRPVTAAAVADAFRQAAEDTALKGVMAVLEEEFASARIVGETHSAIIDLPLVQVIGDTMVSVAAWYDNEMGYATRLAEMAAQLAAA